MAFAHVLNNFTVDGDFGSKGDDKDGSERMVGFTVGPTSDSVSVGGGSDDTGGNGGGGNVVAGAYARVRKFSNDLLTRFRKVLRETLFTGDGGVSRLESKISWEGHGIGYICFSASDASSMRTRGAGGLGAELATDHDELSCGPCGSTGCGGELLLPLYSLLLPPLAGSGAGLDLDLDRLPTVPVLRVADSSPPVGGRLLLRSAKSMRLLASPYLLLLPLLL